MVQNWERSVTRLCIVFNFYAAYAMQNAGWMKHKLESRLLGEISTASDMQMIPFKWEKAKRN